MPNTTDSKSGLLTTSEAASYVRLSVSTLNVDRCTRELNIPFVKYGRAVRYRQQDLDRFIASRMVGLAEAA